ncbi:MAG: phosphodiesterase [Clostridioides sp.]|nr:phosphodiesterase [Clostridioides sp.]
MKIGILSDTHGSLAYFSKAMDVLSDCDMYFHAGDVLYNGPRNILPQEYDPKNLVEKINSIENIIFSKGNCDATVDEKVINHPILSPYAFYQIGNKKCIICHGDNNKEEFIEKASKMNIDLLIFGHTHVKEYKNFKGMIIINPGSTSLPKDGTHSVAKVEILENDELDVKFFNLDTNEEINVET